VARTVSVTSLTARIRRLCDLENNQHVTDAGILDLLNEAYPVYYDMLIGQDCPDIVLKKVSFSSVAGTLEYAFSSIASDGDFYKLRSLHRRATDGSYIPVRKFSNSENNYFRPVQVAETLYMQYYPSAPVLAGGDSVEGYNGWEDWLVYRVCARIMQKRKEDFSQFQANEAREEARITKSKDRDAWEPSKVIRRKREKVAYPWDTSRVDGYRVAGDKLELVTLGGLW